MRQTRSNNIKQNKVNQKQNKAISKGKQSPKPQQKQNIKGRVNKQQKSNKKQVDKSVINIHQMQEYVDKEDPIKKLKTNNNNNKNKEDKNIDIRDNIDLKFIPRYQNLKLSKTQETTLPVMIQLKVKIEQLKEDKRSPIDLVCVIDDSGSMYGKKAQLVRKSLKYLLKLMNENDRICLICYDDNSKVLTPFMRNTQDNKQELKKAIKYIQGRGCTNISAGIEKGLWMLQNRKQKNPVSCMFLLSDGQDNTYYNGITNRVQDLIDFYDIQESYTINCYGYGTDHNPDVMLDIAKMKKGNFYFIEDLKKIDEWFILSLSGLLTVLAENIRICLKNEDGHQITKYYGQGITWDKENNINIPYLTQNCKKDFIFELTFPKQKKLLKDSQKQAKILQGILGGRDLKGNLGYFQIESDFNIQFLNHNEKVYLEDDDDNLNIDFEVTYLRTKGGEIIGEACELSKQGEYEKANKMLNDFLEDLEKCKYKEHNKIQYIKQDVIKSLDVCKPQVFHLKGKGFMGKKQQDHINDVASLCNDEDWDEEQCQQFDNYRKGDYNLSDDSCSIEIEQQQQQKSIYSPTSPKYCQSCSEEEQQNNIDYSVSYSQ